MKKYIITLLLVSAGLTACDFLDEQPYDWADPNLIFSGEISYMLPTNEAYSYIRSGFNSVGGAFPDAATDDGASTVTGANINNVGRGYLTSLNPVFTCWDNSYQGIRQALYAKKYYNEVPLTMSGKTPEQIEAQKVLLKAELDGLRALFEFDLLKFYGGFAIMDELYDIDDPALDLKTRDSFKDCVEHIVALCDAAAPNLGVAGSQVGKMSKGAVMAIKAKTLVYAASPLYNRPGNTNPLLGYTETAGLQQRWKDAAKACADVINLNTNGTISPTGTKQYNLVTTAYDAMFTGNYPQGEFIVVRGATTNNTLENRQMPPSLSQGLGGGTVPSQNLIDAFTMKDGSDFVPGAGVNPQYTNRDPRFALVVGYNGFIYGTGATRTIYTRVAPDPTIDGLNVTLDRSTNTGYYLTKFINKAMNLSGTSPGVTQRVWPIIRLSDILLLYAEAMTNAYGISSDPQGFGLTAMDAVSNVRKRVYKTTTDKFLTGVTTSAQLMSKIKQERRIELCFEEQRYFDLRRWMDGDKLSEPVKGVSITGTGSSITYDYITVDATRRFTEKMYFHPIPSSAIKKSPGVVQNPGW